MTFYGPLPPFRILVGTDWQITTVIAFSCWHIPCTSTVVIGVTIWQEVMTVTTKGIFRSINWRFTNFQHSTRSKQRKKNAAIIIHILLYNSYSSNNFPSLHNLTLFQKWWRGGYGTRELLTCKTYEPLIIITNSSPYTMIRICHTENSQTEFPSEPHVDR